MNKAATNMHHYVQRNMHEYSSAHDGVLISAPSFALNHVHPGLKLLEAAAQHK